MKYLLIAIFCFYTLSANSAELLGHISDDTVAAEELNKPQPVNQNPKLTYRVICTEAGETSPECGQSPVEDTLDLRPGSRKHTKPKQKNQ